MPSRCWARPIRPATGPRCRWTWRRPSPACRRVPARCWSCTTSRAGNTTRSPPNWAWRSAVPRRNCTARAACCARGWRDTHEPRRPQRRNPPRRRPRRGPALATAHPAPRRATRARPVARHRRAPARPRPAGTAAAARALAAAAGDGRQRAAAGGHGRLVREPGPASRARGAGHGPGHPGPARGREPDAAVPGRTAGTGAARSARPGGRGDADRARAGQPAPHLRGTRPRRRPDPPGAGPRSRLDAAAGAAAPHLCPPARADPARRLHLIHPCTDPRTPNTRISWRTPMYRIPTPLLLASVVLASLGLASSAWAATPINETRPLSAQGRLEVENLKGRIEVRAWDRNEVKIEGSLGAGVEKLEITGDADNLAVRVRYPKSGGLGFFSGSDKSEPSELRLMVPRQAELEVEAVSADVDVEGMASGEMTIESVSGDVRVVGAPRQASIDSVSGDLNLILNSPQVSTESVSGDIDLRGRLGGEVRV